MVALLELITLTTLIAAFLKLPITIRSRTELKFKLDLMVVLFQWLSPLSGRAVNADGRQDCSAPFRVAVNYNARLPKVPNYESTASGLDDKKKKIYIYIF